MTAAKTNASCVVTETEFAAAELQQAVERDLA